MNSWKGGIACLLVLCLNGAWCADYWDDCAEGSHRCGGGICIDNNEDCSHCDRGEELCPDGTCMPDYKNCIAVTPTARWPGNDGCPLGQRRCLDGSCRPEYMNCNPSTTSRSSECSSFETTCSDGRCISLSENCDGYQDNEGGWLDDEKCATPSNERRLCEDKSCINYFDKCPEDAHYYGSDWEIGWWRFLGIPVMIVLVIAGAMCRLWMYRSRQQRMAGRVHTTGGALAVPPATGGNGMHATPGSYPTQNYAPPPAYGSAVNQPAAGAGAYPPTSSAGGQFPPMGEAYPPPSENGAYVNHAFPGNGPNSDLPPYPGPQTAPSAPPPSYEEITKDNK